MSAEKKQDQDQNKNLSPIAQREEEILKYWDDNDIFQKTLAKDSPKGDYIFFEGPPTANGRPGIHHVLARSFKDIIPRYKTMQGYHVERKAGWDTHGLPVELQVEKQLGISGKPEIEKYGIEEFNHKCKQSVWEYKDEWEKLTNRIGYWLDLDNAYITYNNEYIESLWWVCKQVHEKGLLYKGHKVVPHCPRCGTALSSHEVAQGYKTVKDKSVYVKFKIKDEQDTYILSWTTTPWTLPGNVGLAVGEDIDYVKVKYDGQIYIVAKKIYENIDGKDSHPLFVPLYEGEGVTETIKGKDLLGLEYEPLIPGCIDKGETNAWTVVKGDFVTTEDGTGVVHTAVMYGEDDYSLGEKNNLPFVHTVGEDGKFLPCVEKWAGKFVKDPEVEKGIIDDLLERNMLVGQNLYEHEYPFCWRCDSPLLYYANDSWFIKMTQLKQELIDNNQTINWVPNHIKDGRFGEWLNNIRDWAISRQRYWGTPIPVWECADCHEFKVIGSIEELEKESGSLPKDKEGNVDVHRPYIDELEINCSCGKKMKRISDVFDCWYDSGCMPFAQHHYPFEKKDLIDKGKQFPADYIAEAIDQTRGWFYTLLAVSTLLGKEAPYKNVICLGHIRDKHGKKMSKSKGNVVDPWMIADKYGIDALRMHLYSINQPGDPKNFDERMLQKDMRKVVMLLGNVVNYYELHHKDEVLEQDLVLKNILDKWIMSKLNIFVKDVTKDLDDYHVFEASRKVVAFIDELSTWYVRRSRDRFKQDGADKDHALKTLHTVLMTLIKVMAPFTPFVTESVYQRLKGNLDSVHLDDWPLADDSLIDLEIVKKMQSTQKVVEIAHALRAQAKLKVRQPLAELFVDGLDLDESLSTIIAEEVNVKQVTAGSQKEQADKWINKQESILSVSLDIELTPELKQEGLIRELIRHINGVRKKQGLTIQDMVSFKYQTQDQELAQVIESNKEDLLKGVLGTTIESSTDDLEWESLKINDVELLLFLDK